MPSSRWLVADRAAFAGFQIEMKVIAVSFVGFRAEDRSEKAAGSFEQTAKELPVLSLGAVDELDVLLELACLVGVGLLGAIAFRDIVW